MSEYNHERALLGAIKKVINRACDVLNEHYPAISGHASCLIRDGEEQAAQDWSNRAADFLHLEKDLAAISLVLEPYGKKGRPKKDKKVKE